MPREYLRARYATDRFDMKLTPAMKHALDECARREGITKTAFLVKHIEARARRYGIPTWDRKKP